MKVSNFNSISYRALYILNKKDISELTEELF